MAYLKVENVDQTTFRLSPVSFRAPCWNLQCTLADIAKAVAYIINMLRS